MSNDWQPYLDELKTRNARALAQGGDEAIRRLHERGKLTARERIERLVDKGSFEELGLLAQGFVPGRAKGAEGIPGDAVVTGWGEIDGRRVLIAADDGSIMGGAGSILNVEKRFRLRRIAVEQGYPYIGLYEGSAIRFQDSMDAAIMTRIPAFKEVADCAGVVPQIAAVLGPCFGRPPADIVFSQFALMAEKTGFLGLSGPTLVQGGIGEKVDIAELAGPKMHALKTGLIDHVAATEDDCITTIKTFLQFMPQNAWQRPARRETKDDPNRACPELMKFVPSNVRKPYDVRPVIETICDSGVGLEYKPDFGKGIVTRLDRIDGEVVGIVASQPKYRGGVIDAHAAFKGRRFVAVCDAFNIPLVFLQDQPGFMPGKESEEQNVVFWGNTFIAAVQRATVPKITVVLRKGHGAAMWAMGFGGEYGEGADLVAAWPSAILTGTGPASAVYTVHAKELAAAENAEELRNRLERQYSETGSAYRGAMSFGIQSIIEPADTRRYLAAALRLASEKLKRNLGPKPQLFP